jgi:hypothetical protein
MPPPIVSKCIPNCNQLDTLLGDKREGNNASVTVYQKLIAKLCQCKYQIYTFDPVTIYTQHQLSSRLGDLGVPEEEEQDQKQEQEQELHVHASPPPPGGYALTDVQTWPQSYLDVDRASKGGGRIGKSPGGSLQHACAPFPLLNMECRRGEEQEQESLVGCLQAVPAHHSHNFLFLWQK